MALALQSLVGVVLLPLAAYAMCEKHGRIDLPTAVRTTAAGLGLIDGRPLRYVQDRLLAARGSDASARRLD